MKDRDTRGRFRKGHAVKSPGRPALAAELPITDGIKAAVTAEDVAQVLEKMRLLAIKRGNTKAASLYLAYALGKPKEFLDITGNLGLTWKAVVKSAMEDNGSSSESDS